MGRVFGFCSSIALAAAMVGGAAQAQSLNLGGIGVDLGSGGSDGSGVNVTVETGNDSTPDAAVSLGGDDAGASAGSGSNSVVGVDLGGSGNADAAVGVDLGSSNDNDGVLGLDDGGGSGGGGSILDLGGSGGVGLFGSGGAPDVAIGDDDDGLIDVGPGRDDDVNLRLFGDGKTDETLGVGDTDIDLDVGGSGNAGSTLPGIDGLFGDGGTDVGTILGLFGDGGTPGDIGGLTIDLGGASETSATGGQGSGGGTTVVPGTGDGGSADGGLANGGVGSGSSITGGSNAIQVAVAAPRADCFAPNAQQIGHLLASRDYDASMSARWASADKVDLVPVKLCPQARAQVAAAISRDSDIQWLQDAAMRDPRIGARLQQAGLDGNNVLALDAKSGRLAVYVF